MADISRTDDGGYRAMLPDGRSADYDRDGNLIGAPAPTGPTEAHQHEIRFAIDCAACIQELNDDLDRRSTTHRDNEGGS